MIRFLHAWFPKSAFTTRAPRAMSPRFKPGVERLDDRITPALGFATQQTLTVGPAPLGVVIGDFDGDGRPDLATANNGDAGNGTTISVLMNTTPSGSPTPTFAAKQDFTVGTGPFSIAVGDFNGDGRADLAVTNYNGGGGNTVSVLLNTTPSGAAAVSFAPQQTFTVGMGPLGITVGDFNSDGRADLAVSNNTAGAGTTLSVLLNTTPMQSGTASFATKQDFTVGTGPYFLTAADLNGDGRDDLAVANNGTNNVSVLLNTTTIGVATATFAAKQDFTVGTSPRDVTVGDFNGDGRYDLAVSNSGAATVSVLLNTTALGTAPVAFAAKQDFTVGSGPFGVAVADFDGDGRTDIAAANAGTTTVSLLLNTTAPGGTTPTFATKQDFTVGTGPIPLTAGDLNGDGRPDLVAGNYGGFAGTTVSVLRNTSTNVLPTTTGPALVAQFGSTGVWAYKRDTSTWIQLTSANANALAASASGNVVASFGGNGVWYYRASNQSWTQINGNAAAAVAIDPLGNAYINFGPAFGTYVYRLATNNFAVLPGTSAGADKLAVSANGDVIANFNGFGVYRFRWTTNTWEQLNGFNATSLDVDPNGYVVASFTGFGVGHYIPYAQGWRTVAPLGLATAVALDGYGNIHASFPGNGGIFKYDYTNSWKNIAPSATANTLAADWYGNVFASFNGFPGVWEFAPHYGWNWRPQGFATIVSLAK